MSEPNEAELLYAASLTETVDELTKDEKQKALEPELIKMAKADAKLEWVLHADESCNDCLRLGGKVKQDTEANFEAQDTIFGLPVVEVDDLEAGEVPVLGPQLLEGARLIGRAISELTGRTVEPLTDAEREYVAKHSALIRDTSDRPCERPVKPI